MSEIRIPGEEQGRPAEGAGEGVVFLESALWKRLNEAASREEIAAAWLVLQCRMIAGAAEAALWLRPDDGGAPEPAASWPEGGGRDPSLKAVADLALRERRGVVGESRDRRPALAYPVLVGEEPAGVVAIGFTGVDAAALRPAMRQLQWGTAWLRDRVRRQSGDASERQLARLRATLDFIGAALEHDGFAAAATAVVTELAVTEGCERVSLGFRRGGSHKVAAVSHSAQFGKQMNLVRLLAAAMDEAVDQQALILYPQPEGGDPVATTAHQRLAAAHHGGHILTVPLLVADRFAGAITLERAADRPFDAETIAVIDGVATAIGPILNDKRLNDRWIGAKLADAAGRQLRRLFGPAHVGRKLAALGAVAVAAFLTFATGDYRVTAEAEIEGLVRRAVVAPADGFIKEAAARPGDTVTAGAVLASLDDRDLALQRLRWVTERQQYTFQYDKALAARDRTTVNVVRTQIDQADAQIRLIDEQLARATLTAPFDGIVISGDLSQRIGAPVSRGEKLFEIAPLDGYRVNMWVDERQVADVAVGQAGELLAASLPEEPFAFVVEKITPVAEQLGGRNVFRVEGRLTDNSERLRPGMNGIAKIAVDRRRLVAIWAQPLVDWAAVRLWQWMP